MSFSFADILATASTTGDDIVTGTVLRDVLTGQAGNDVINGQAGDDDIYGGNGDDQIDGGEGSDYLSGENGSDRYRVGDMLSADGRDVIDDEGATGDSDTLSLGEIGPAALITEINVDDLNISIDGGGHVLEIWEQLAGKTADSD